MSNFTIEFLNSPWWLVLLIPAFFLALFPHFRIAKKYRRNRNRIVSLVLHLVIMTLCIFTLSGIYFAYDKDNTSNEVIILVDMSFSSENYGNESNNKNEFVRAVIDESRSKYKIGVVTFGSDQVYAAKMSTDTEEVYSNYLSAKRPDDSASDLAGALEYARSLFTGGRNGKIVLISDGEQTDGNAVNAIRILAANNIQVNAAHFPNDYTASNEVLIYDIELPDYNVSLDEEFTVTAMLHAKNAGLGSAVLTLYDDSTANGETEIEVRNIEVVAAEQAFEFTLKLSDAGMHKLRFNVRNSNDELDYNNDYYSYIFIESFSNILIIEKESDDSANFVKSLNEEYTPTVIQIGDTQSMPKTLDALREYDEVVLMNIANRDMPEGFIDLLYTYVHDIGGGLFTVGGTREDEYGNKVPNMYDRNDMYEISDDGAMVPTLYQDMLPVQSINYTPPLGVMIIIDRSGSMGSHLATGTRLDSAKEGAIAAVYALSERDYCGIMTLDTEFQVEQSLINATQQARLLRTINDIEMGGGTQYKGAIQRAGEALLSRRDVERRHIILISDGEPGDQPEEYLPAIEANYAAGITFSMVAIGIDQNSEADKKMSDAAAAGHGRYYRVWDDTLADKMSQELRLPEITDISSDPLNLFIHDHTAVANGVDETTMPRLGGYFGTKIKDDAYAPVRGSTLANQDEATLVSVPVLAHWRYGEGRVGSFMCDLSGNDWSEEFLSSETGVKILNNAVRTLLPTVTIRSTGISVDFTEDNYSTHASIFTEMSDGDRIELAVYSVPTGDQTEELLQKIAPTKEQGFSNITFKITKAGVYKVVISKLDEDGKVLAQHTSYRVFSYSKEYDIFVDEEVSLGLMAQLASIGRGRLIPIEEPWSVFDKDIDTLHNKFDPRWLFMIIAMVLFLLDIAVRKFKWKWIHEIVRERKEKHAAAHDHNGSPTE